VRRVAVIGAGMTRFGKWLDRSLKDLGREAIDAALEQAGIEKNELQVAVVGNAAAGLITGQEMVLGQVILRDVGIGRIPVINTENACASSSSAVHIAWMYVASGMYDVALALGVEKLYHADKSRSFAAIGAAVDVELLADVEAAGPGAGDRGSRADSQPLSHQGAGESRSIFMDIYAGRVREHMKRYGTTPLQMAKVAVKSHENASLNPFAQYRERYTIEDVLNSPVVVEPLTRLMCSPIGDGAAAVILCSEAVAKKFTTKPIWVTASVLASGWDREPGEPEVTTVVARRAYEMAGVGPEDLDVIELHDAAAPAELIECEEIGLCAPGEGGRLIDEGVTTLAGRIPVNPSGGLLSKGHPIGATGCAQIAEIFWQLRGEAGRRQVKNGDARIGLAHNGGGLVRGEPGAMCIHIFQR
jgi:acetyl-CoA acyltransferase